ncbi:class I SAM-dependent methyltransferase [Kineococcus gynurae]|uniref:Class I SAM-dependent methyltransferase n=1 Tax=Kineococcus gynurae TaxID=452979 RepID=A0ABV5LQ34_9ACTN
MEHGHHGQETGHGHEHGAPTGEVDHGTFLDLDAEVFGRQLVAAVDGAGVTAPRHVVDVGAGSGAGSRMLRERFPQARLSCLDRDPVMLAGLREQGFDAVEVDLDDGFPDLRPDRDGPAPDLVWMSSALHHVVDPAGFLASVRAAMDPAGTLLVVELAGLPSFLDGTGPDAGFEAHAHALAAAQGWNRYPDWTPLLVAAGFDVATDRSDDELSATPAARRYGAQWLLRLARVDGLAEQARDGLLRAAREVAADRPVRPRASRTRWTARPRTA